MKSRILWCLAGINAALLLMALLPSMRPSAAMAQRLDRGQDYMLIPGQISGSDAGVVYILNESGNLLGGMTFDEGRGRLITMRPVDLIEVFDRPGNGRE